MEVFLPIIIDAFIVLCAVFMVWMGVKRGFIRTAIYAVGYLASLIISSVVGKWLGTQIAQWLRNPLVDYTTKKIGTQTGSLSESIQAIYDQVPVFLQNFMNQFGTPEEVAEKISLSTQSVAQNSAEQITDHVILPLVTSLIGVILFFVLFFICSFLVRKIAYATGAINYIPIVGGLNRFAGGLIGIVEAVVFVFLLVLIISFILSCVSNGAEIAEKTVLFQWINGWMPFFRIS